MTTSQHILSCITNGAKDDAAISAALDALREDDGCSLLDAVLTVAREWNAMINARDLVEATQYLAKGSPIREALEQTIAGECLNVGDGATLTIITEQGDHWPRAVDTSLFTDGAWFRSFHVTVGAGWVKRVANRLMIETEREAKRPRRRRRK